MSQRMCMVLAAVLVVVGCSSQEEPASSGTARATPPEAPLPTGNLRYVQCGIVKRPMALAKGGKPVAVLVHFSSGVTRPVEMLPAFSGYICGFGTLPGDSSTAIPEMKLEVPDFLEVDLKVQWLPPRTSTIEQGPRMVDKLVFVSPQNVLDDIKDIEDAIQSAEGADREAQCREHAGFVSKVPRGRPPNRSAITRYLNDGTFAPPSPEQSTALGRLSAACSGVW